MGQSPGNGKHFVPLTNEHSSDAPSRDGDGGFTKAGLVPRIRWLWGLKATWIGCALSVLIGIVLLSEGGGVLTRLSYDVTFPLQKMRAPPEELVMVYIDAEVKRRLNQPADRPLDRRFHAQLLDRLRRDGAKLVLFDLLFDQPISDPSADEEFAAAIRRYGHVVLVALDFDERQVGTNQDIHLGGVIPPIPILGDAAAASGLARIDYDPGYFVRRLFAGTESEESAGWAAASLLGAPVTKQPQRRLEPRWINYYCAPKQLRAVNFDQALAPGGLAEGYLQDKIVVVGRSDDPEDNIFQTPYSRFASGLVSSGPVSPGAAIHAMNLLNLLRGDWMTRLGFIPEMLIVIAWGVFTTTLLMLLRPWPAICAALALGGLFAGGSVLLAIEKHVWFPWAVPVAAQMPFALVWSLGFESVRRHRLRRAFGLYLSPYMADRIANSDFDLSLGGKEVEATVMFTDLEGFTKMSESLSPTAISKVLTTYFSRTTRGIFESDGTLLRYVGDGVMAGWGAPLPNLKHAYHAVRAALAMTRAGQAEVEGLRLRSRIGINTGIFLAGNLGSEHHFDYTLLGDATNLASRLEGLNKQLGTEILISETTARQLNDDVKLRGVGRFILAGMSKPAAVYEVLGQTTEFDREPEWLGLFARALDHFAKREFDAAEALFLKTIQARQGKDGPSRFYLQEIEAARGASAPDSRWDGTVRLAEK
jgi:adenylate cyclase